MTVAAIARWDTVLTGVVNEVSNEDETGSFRLPGNQVCPPRIRHAGEHKKPYLCIKKPHSNFFK